MRIFLAGPTPRLPKSTPTTGLQAIRLLYARWGITPSWRPGALRLLEAGGYTGRVFVPEFRDPDRSSIPHPNAILDWETEKLEQSVVLFWVPRDRVHLPGFTTNVEFGMHVHRGPEEVVFGAPPNAVKMDALVYHAQRHGLRRFFDLESTVEQAQYLAERHRWT